MKIRDTWIRSIRAVAECYAVELGACEVEGEAGGDRWVSAEKYYALWADLIEQSPIDAVPVVVGKNIRLSEFGVMAAASLAAPDLRRFIDYWVEFMHLFSPELAALKLRTSESYALELQPVGPPLHWGAHVAQLVVFNRLYQEIAHPWQRLSHIELDCAEPDDVPVYAEAFQTELQFDAGVYRLHFDAAELSVPLPGGNANLFESAWKLTQEELQEALPTLTRRVTDLIRNRLSEGHIPRVEDMAPLLHLSPRTLQRKLAAEGESVSNLVETTQLSLAMSALRRRQSWRLAEVGYRCGFNDPAAFSRFFKRHTGTTPREFRTQVGNNR